MLKIENLSVRYPTPGGAVRALNGISLDLAKGRTLAIVGESGSGKSTIALAVMGLLPAQAEVSAGTLSFLDTDLRALTKDAWRALRGARIAMVFQDPFSVLNPSLRIGEQIGEGLRHHRRVTADEAHKRAIALLDEVGIADPAAVARAYPHELSGGMRQRALIASALATEPELLVLDEPTTALDVTIEAQILDLLQSLQAKRGLAMLLISHNLGVVRRIADDVAVVYAGEVLEFAPADRIFASPSHPYTKGLLAAIPRLGMGKQPLASIPGGLPDLRAPPAGCIFRPRCPFADDACGTPQHLRAIGLSQVRCHRAAALLEVPWRTSDVQAGTKEIVRIMDGGPVVEASGVSKTYVLAHGLGAFAFEGWRPVIRRKVLKAVDDVSLEIAAGEVLGVVGESGSGKTTLGRAILRLVDPDRGLIRIAGETVSDRPQGALETMRRQAQIVFQNPDSSLNPRKTVRDIIGRSLVRFGIVSPADVPARVRALLDLVRLPAYYEDRYPHQMSGGEKQRVGIARALASEPKLLVCDEPVSALDVSVQAAIVNLLADLRDRLGVAYLLISHDLSVVAHLADRIAVMYRGRIVEIGPAREIVGSPQHPYSRALLSAVPTLDDKPGERIRLLPEKIWDGAPRACGFAGRCPEYLGKICDDVDPVATLVSLGHRARCHRVVPSDLPFQSEA